MMRLWVRIQPRRGELYHDLRDEEVVGYNPILQIHWLHDPARAFHATIMLNRDDDEYHAQWVVAQSWPSEFDWCHVMLELHPFFTDPEHESFLVIRAGSDVVSSKLTTRNRGR